MSKFFLKTVEHDGVFYKDSFSTIHLGSMLINMNSIERIIFDSDAGTQEADWEVKHSITFYPGNPENELFSFYFTQEGIGEYQRLKRTIENLIA